MPDPASAVMAWLMAPGQGEPLTFLEDIVHRPAWQRYGACRGVDIEAFIPNRGGRFGPARELCQRCAVRQDCFDFAMADDELVGMWGGTTEPERREMRAGRGVA
jgi:hypothetical protein